MNSPADVNHSPIHLPGYTWIDSLYQGAKTVVYRAVEEASQRPVVIKCLHQACPSFEELVRFRNQYTITKNLSVPGVLKPLGLEPCGNGYALIVEDIGSVSLDQYLQQQPLTLIEVLSIGVQLAEILRHLHHQRVIHKDIKPANILIHPDSRRVTLIDFSIASLLPKETQAMQSPKNLEGTLAYLAPEQSGRMNRAIDYRSDFYALGITLYQLFTGQLPFTSQDPLELLHSHIAQIPASIEQIKPELPAVVAAIVAKLMAKNAEDRYQSALGLKHDLEQCLIEWKEQGAITDFELGQRDLSDRFTIPEKLYGREAEVNALLSAFERVTQGSAELMLVAGFSGIGKTVAVNEVHKPIVRQRGYFIKGKFDQFNRNVPFSAFVQAFGNLSGQLLGESDTELEIWRQQILDALGENAQVMIDLVPALENVLAPQPPAPALSGTAAQNRFNLVFQKFIQVFTTPAHPLVIFVDDLQWADAASLRLIQSLMTEARSQHLLLLGAYRDNEVYPAHPLMLSLDEIAKAQAPVHTLTLAPLSLESLNQLVADTLHVSLTVAQPLTDLVMQKTQGNPFFATQFLNTLHQDQLITFDSSVGHWQCDLVKVQAAALTNDVVELMAQRLRRLAVPTQRILKLAACIGAQFTLETLAIVSQQSQADVADQLWQALQAGLVIPQSNIYKFYVGDQNAAAQAAGQTVIKYRFLHDRVQQAAYSLIPQDQKQLSHLSIGRHLLQHASAQQLEEQLFDIVGQLNVGLPLVTEAAERATLLELNLRASKKAIATTAYSTATGCVTIACDLLSSNCWDDQYDLSLDCYSVAMETAYLSGDFERMDAMFDTIQHHARKLLDAAKAYEIKIDAYTNQGKLAEAVELGLTFLAAFDITFPTQPNSQDIGAALEKTQALLAGRTAQDLIDLPAMGAPEPKACLKLLIRLGVSAYLSRPDLHPLIICQQVQLSVTYGNSPISASGYAAYGILLGPAVGDYDGSFSFGQLALTLIERAENRACAVEVLVIVYHFVFHWKQPLALTLDPLRQAYNLSIETGDLAYAGYAAYIYGLHAYCSGYQLDTLVDELSIYSQGLERIQQQTALRYNRLFHQVVLNLMGHSLMANSSPTELNGPVFDEITSLPLMEQAKDQTGLLHFYINKTILSYLFQDLDAVECYANQAHQYAGSGVGMPHVPLLYFYEALAVLQRLNPDSQATDSQVTDSQATDSWQLISTAKEKLSTWAHHAPANCQHRYDLLCAEENRILGNQLLALEGYDRAIAGAKANQFVQEEALANELAANFYLGWGREKIAALYMQEAYYCYSRWGAKAKVADLERCYPDLLRSILQPSAVSGDALTTLMTIVAPAVSVQTSTHHNSYSASLNQTFDLNSIFKAAQALSGTIQLDELLYQLTQIILTNSGGDRCALILPNEAGEWQVRAIANASETTSKTTPKPTLYTEPLEHHANLPVKLIQYVKNTQETVVVDGLKTALSVVDEYLRQRQPKSLLCLPILNQGRCIGVLSLENQITEGAFTEERILILNFLCTQAAISIENARLFAETVKVETSLRQSQEKLKKTANSLPGLIYQFRLDAEGKSSFPYLSDRATELLGIEPHMLKGSAEALIQRIHPEDIPTFERYLNESMKDLVPFIWTGRVQFTSSQVKWVEARSTPTLQADGSCLWDGVMLDVSDRKAAEVALAESEAYHRNLFDQSAIGLLICRMDGELIYANQAYADILGRKKAELSALTYWEITPQKYAEAEQAQLQRLCSEGYYGPYEKEYIHQSGELIPVRLSGVLVEREGEQLIWSSIEDISDRKRAENAVLQKSHDLEKALADLKNAQLSMVQSEKMSALGGLVAGVAHEINNPVGCIIGNVEATKHYIEDLLHLIDLYGERLTEPDEALAEELEDIDLDYVKQDLPKLIQAMKDSGDRIKSISRSLRTFSRADTETKQIFNLHEGLDSTVLILRHRLKANDLRPAIAVTTEYGELPEVACFPGQLNQVFMNILANAIDALDEASQHRSFAELTEVPNKITIRTALDSELDNQRVKISISDNGPGIPESVQAKIFEHLFTTKEVGKGTGLGLAIAHQIVVDTHGGSLEVTSELGQGSEFCIQLPL